MKMNHEQIWLAIDRAAAEHGFSASGLARRAGMDATTFNRSKRYTSHGKGRWPSTESLYKILSFLDLSLIEFIDRYMGERIGLKSAIVPLIKFSEEVLNDSLDAEGYLKVSPANEIIFPSYDSKLQALEIIDDAFAPTYRCGDRLMVSPGASVRRGDRVVMKTLGGFFICELLSSHTLKVECRDEASGQIRVWNKSEVLWMNRILWIEPR
jgi:phage repressor protein C with HTH and peptisase S24 domain